MKENNTTTLGRKQIVKESKLTIGLDLEDRSSHYCLDEAGNVLLEQQPADNTEGNPAGLQQDPAQSDRPGNRDALPLGEPAIERNGAWTGAEVDYQVAAPAEMRTPNLHRAKNR
jgi:hypothetical protein